MQKNSATSRARQLFHGGRVFNPAAAYKAALLALLARDLLSDPAARLLDAKDRLAFLH